MSPKALPYISILATFWGTSLVVSRFSLGQFDSLDFIFLRLFLAGAAYLAITLIGRDRHFPRGREIWKHGIMLSIFATVIPMSGVVISLNYQSSGVTSLILTLAPAITVLLAHFFLPDEKLNRHKTLGIALALSGGALLILQGENGLPDVTETNPIGYMLVLTTVIVGSCMVIYIRKNMQDVDTIEVSSIRMWGAALIMLPVAYFISGLDMNQVKLSGIAAVLYTGLVGTFGGMLLDFYNIKRFGATASAMVSVLIPIVTIVCGAIFLGEAISTVMILSMALIIGGVAILNFWGQPETLPHTPENIQL